MPPPPGYANASGSMFRSTVPGQFNADRSIDEFVSAHKFGYRPPQLNRWRIGIKFVVYFWNLSQSLKDITCMATRHYTRIESRIFPRLPSEEATPNARLFRQSDDVEIFLQVDGTTISTKNILDLKNLYFRLARSARWKTIDPLALLEISKWTDARATWSTSRLAHGAILEFVPNGTATTTNISGECRNEPFEFDRSSSTESYQCK